MTPLALAWRGLTRQPARAVLGVAGIAIVGALLLDMLLLSRGLQVSFERLLESAGFDLRVTATDALAGTSPPIEDGTSALGRAAALPQIAQAVGFRFGRARVSGRSIDLIGATGPARGTWRVVEGADLAFGGAGAPPLLLINERLARASGASVGSTLSVHGTCAPEPAALPPVTFHVAGIVEFRFETRADLTALTDLDGFAAACEPAEPGALDLLLLAPATGVLSADAVAAARAALPGLHVLSNRELVDRLEVSNFAYFRQVSFALSTVTLFFAFLLTTTLLTVSINQRLGEVAGLRALGFTRRRVVIHLVCESALLVGAGGLLSLPLGAASAMWLDAILREMPGIPARVHFFVFRPGALALHAALLIGTGLAASLYPVWLAARLPIAATLRKETVS
jgi:putative ABC transport system permease protein